MEKEVECWMKSYTKVSCPPPIGTANSEPMEEDELEEDEEEDEHDNEDSDSRCVCVLTLKGPIDSFLTLQLNSSESSLKMSAM